jgi:hypothetical protein
MTVKELREYLLIAQDNLEVVIRDWDWGDDFLNIDEVTIADSGHVVITSGDQTDGVIEHAEEL